MYEYKYVATRQGFNKKLFKIAINCGKRNIYINYIYAKI